MCLGSSVKGRAGKSGRKSIKSMDTHVLKRKSMDTHVLKH